MGILFESIYTPGIAQISYFVGDAKAGIAAVIDPRRDIGPYLALARQHGVKIAYAIETHIHADFVSGVHELAARTQARIVGGQSGDYEFELDQLTDGQRLDLGSVALQALHTAGHTPEHISLLLSDSQQGEQPFAVFTGDTLFNLDVGRPDLVGNGTERALARALHHSLFDRLVPLGDRVEVYPCHGAGSACGKSIGDRRHSTIGNERLFNPALKAERSEGEFVEWLLRDMPPAPRHYARLKRVNADGAPLRGGVPAVGPLLPKAFEEQSRSTPVLDVRSILAFGGGHVPGALNIALRDEFPTWAGSMLDAGQRLLLVAEDASQAFQAIVQLYRIGIDDVAGYLIDGMTAWQNAGLPLASIDQWSVDELNRRRGDPDVVVLDVRNDAEFANGHVPNARHMPLIDLREHSNQVDRKKTIATFCGSGYRASIAASLLEQNGFEHVASVPGSWNAWCAASLPTQT